MSALNNSSRASLSKSETMKPVEILGNKWDLVRIAFVVLGMQAVIRLMILLRQLNY